MGRCLLAMKKGAEALATAKEAQTLAEQIGDRQAICESRLLLAEAWLEHGDPEAPVDFLCHTAHLRAAAFGIELTPHGDCEYCNGGEREELISASAARLLAEAPEMPIGTLGTGTGGCSSCHAT